MTALEYFKEKARMTETSEQKVCGITCRECPLNSFINGKSIPCSSFEMLYPEEAIAAVKEWAEENPKKTRLQDFLEKYPNAELDGKGFPLACAEELGYCSECDCRCTKCWNEPVE